MMRVAFVLLVGLILPGLPARSEVALAGTWEGTVTVVTTELAPTVNAFGFTVVAVTPVSDVQPSPSGPLILYPDGRYAMPDTGYSGEWRQEGDALRFSGPLEESAGRIEVQDAGPFLFLTLPGADGLPQEITFHRRGD
ncbi:MAG: hypothetical protein ACK4GM_11455 [Tabrizicola sp.]